MIRSLALAAVGLALAGPVAAHRLIVFAYVEAEEIVVEAKFSNDRPAVAGEIRLESEAAEVLDTAPLDPSGTTRLPIAPGYANGVVVRVSTGTGHSDYWVLTPVDLGADD